MPGGQAADRLRITPPRGFRFHPSLDAVRARAKPGNALSGRERAIVEEMTLHVIGKTQAILRTRHEILVHPLRIRIGEVVDEAAAPRAGLVRKPGWRTEGVLGVPDEKAKPLVSAAAKNAEPIVRSIVSEKVGKDRIAVAHIKDDKHLI